MSSLLPVRCCSGVVVFVGDDRCSFPPVLPGFRFRALLVAFAVEAQPRPGSDEISDFASAREDVLVKRFPLCYGFPMKHLQTGIACCFTHCFIKSTVPDFAPHFQNRTSIRLQIEVFTNYVIWRSIYQPCC